MTAFLTDQTALLPRLSVSQFSRSCRHCMRTVNVEHFVTLDEDRIEGTATTLLYCDQCCTGLETIWQHNGSTWETAWHERHACESSEKHQEILERIANAQRV